MTRQELINLLSDAARESAHTLGAVYDDLADAVIAAGFIIDPEPVTVTLPHEIAEYYATYGEGSQPGTLSATMRAACREALGMEP